MVYVSKIIFYTELIACKIDMYTEICCAVLNGIVRFIKYDIKTFLLPLLCFETAQK